MASPHLRRISPLGRNHRARDRRQAVSRPGRPVKLAAIGRRAVRRLDLSGHDAMSRPSDLVLRDLPGVHSFDR